MLDLFEDDPMVEGAARRFIEEVEVEYRRHLKEVIHRIVLEMVAAKADKLFIIACVQLEN